MKFADASAVRDVIDQMWQTDFTAHSFNRAKIDELFEGFPPYSDEESEINHYDTNINFLEAPGLAHKARSTWNNAMLKPGNFFTVTLDSGPKHKRGPWSHTITRAINRRMKACLSYVETIRATGAQVVIHGIGPVWWERSKCWRPDEVGIEDLLVPSGTRVKLNNLSYFAIYRRYTPEELFRMTHGKQVDPGWNMAVVMKELERLASSIMRQTESYQDTMSPERLVKLYKANSGLLDTDAVDTVDVWDFYHQDPDDEKGRWFRKMILNDTTFSGDKFLYNPKRPFAGDLSQILHIQFADGANVAPFLYHTVRSLGFLLFGICHLQNETRCGFQDAVKRAMNEYFRVENAEDRARLQSVDLVNLGIVPPGLQFVPRDQRWQVDEALVLAALSQNRQLMSENAAAFVQDVDQGSAKELTATEVMARLNNANALVSSLLSMAYTYEEFKDREIARRFTMKESGDKDIEGARLEMLKAGIPANFINVERWNIQVERTMGGGNKTLELAQAQSMLQIAPQLENQQAAREIQRDYILAVTDDPDKADRWVPEGQGDITPSEHDAQLAVGALMNGAPVGIRQGIDHISYVEAMLLSMQSMAEDINTIGQPSPQQIIGLIACYKHVSQHIAIIAQDKEEKQRVKRYGDFLKPIMNQVKAWGQQLKEKEQAAQQQNGDGGKAAAAMFAAQAKAKIGEFTTAKKEQRKDIQFAKEQQRKDAQTQFDARRQAHLTDAAVEALDKKTAADIRKKRFSIVGAE